MMYPSQADPRLRIITIRDVERDSGMGYHYTVGVSVTVGNVLFLNVSPKQDPKIGNFNCNRDIDMSTAYMIDHYPSKAETYNFPTPRDL